MTTTARDLRIERVTKQFGDFVAVDDVTLVVPQGSFFALLGPSGCGKTTTLRIVAGLEDPTQGRILIGDQDVTGMRPFKRPVNTVFQSYALFPHLDIYENVAFGLRRLKRQKVDEEVRRMLDLVQMGPLAKRKPAQLSGGQQQRIALARAIVNQPEVLLLDEPLGALDLKLRRQMQIELKRIQTEVGLTFVHVTHDQEEAMTMADTIAVMNQGKVEQLGPPAELYEGPATTFVANFLGQSNLVRGSVTGRADDVSLLDLHGHRATITTARVNTPSSDVYVGVRPEKMHIARTADEVPDGSNRLPGGVVSDVSFIGVSTQYLVRLPWGQELMVFEQNTGVRGLVPVGSEVVLHWRPEHGFALDASQDATAGAEVDEEALAPDTVAAS